MHKSSLLEILRTFTVKELIKFEEFVNSPYHNKKKTVINLFNEIKQYAPEFDDGDLEKEKIWKKLLPEKEYNYGIIKNLIFDLNKLCDQFIAIEKFMMNEYQKNSNYMNSLLDRNAIRVLNTKLESYEKTLQKDFDNNNYEYADVFYSNWKDFYNFKSAVKFNTNPGLKDESDQVKVSEYLIRGFLIDAFKTMNDVVTYNLDLNLIKEKNILSDFLKALSDHKIIENFLENSEGGFGKDNRILKCYYSMYQSVISPHDLDRYKEFKKNFQEADAMISKTELRNLYIGLHTCRVNLNLPFEESCKEAFEINKLSIEKEIILNKSGRIQFQAFISNINVSCELNETGFAEWFIEKFKDKLFDELKDDAYNYAMAQLLFAKSDFEKSLEFNSRINSDSTILKYLSKNLKMKCYFELNDFESFLYVFDSFKHFVKRNKLMNDARTISMTTLGNYIKLLFQLRSEFDEYKFSNLREEISKSKNSSNLWIQRKLKELQDPLNEFSS